jgi:acetyl-CoA synthetase
MSAAAFIEARDFLLEHRGDYERAYREFRWPVLDRFNWALDYFDPMARGNQRPGLWIVDDGGEAKLSFAELAERSSRAANWLRGLGVRRGDRLLLMLGNVVPLWECTLAAMKLGAVIIPATTLLSRDDLLDRFARGRVRHVVAGADNAGKFADLPGEYTRIAVGAPHPAGSAGRRPVMRRPNSPPTARPGPATRCCSISPRAPRRSPSLSYTAIKATRSGF